MWKEILTKGTRVAGKTLSMLSAPKYPIVTGKKLSAGDFVQVWDERSILHGDMGTVLYVGKEYIMVQMSVSGMEFKPTIERKFKLIERP